MAISQSVYNLLRFPINILQSYSKRYSDCSYLNIKLNQNSHIPLFLLYRLNNYGEAFINFKIEDYNNAVVTSSINKFLLQVFRCTYSTTLRFKDQLYYVREGLIIDRDKNILFLIAIELFEDKINKVHIYVSPKVFLNDTTLNKCIIKNIIPYYLQYPITISGAYNGKVEIHLIEYPLFLEHNTIKADMIDNSKLNTFLSEHIHSIINV